MTGTQWVELAAAATGAAGTIILYRNSYTLEPFEGSVFGSPEVTEHNENVKKRNAARISAQQQGFGLLCVSFVLQAVAVLL